VSGAADKAAAGRKSRNKGRDGEQEIARLIRENTGWDVKRRVRQREGDSDLEGIPGWSAEIKRHKTATRGQIRGWWAQAVAQAKGATPVLFFRADRDEWRAVWPGVFHSPTAPDTGYLLSVEGSVYAWAAAARELAPRSTLLEQEPGSRSAEIAQEAA
jgi:hypothetical protein